MFVNVFLKNKNYFIEKIIIIIFPRLVGGGSSSKDHFMRFLMVVASVDSSFLFCLFIWMLRFRYACYFLHA